MCVFTHWLLFQSAQIRWRIDVSTYTVHRKETSRLSSNFTGCGVQQTTRPDATDIITMPATDNEKDESEMGHIWKELTEKWQQCFRRFFDSKTLNPRLINKVLSVGIHQQRTSHCFVNGIIGIKVRYRQYIFSVNFWHFYQPLLVIMNKNIILD